VTNPDPFTVPVWRSPVYHTPGWLITIVQLACPIKALTAFLLWPVALTNIGRCRAAAGLRWSGYDRGTGLPLVLREPDGTSERQRRTSCPPLLTRRPRPTDRPAS